MAQGLGRIRYLVESGEKTAKEGCGRVPVPPAGLNFPSWEPALGEDMLSIRLGVLLPLIHRRHGLAFLLKMPSLSTAGRHVCTSQLSVHFPALCLSAVPATCCTLG